MRIAGIDLGTTNSALATVDPETGAVISLQIDQISGPGTVKKWNTLPSFLYLLHESDGDPALYKLSAPAERPTGVVGFFAKDRGLQVPDRMISSAKSWLCHRQVNRTDKFLPWQSDAVTEKLSPVEVTSHYLAHLKAVFHDTCSGGGETSWVVTVPASFDEVARQLTVTAAASAGITNLTLLEEPLAAFYAWIASTPTYTKEISPGDQILVCDVGGGTTDFTLVSVGEFDGKIELSRSRVGDHLLLGGDNMDLAMAVKARADIEATGKTLDHWQFVALIGQVRDAKERLLNGAENLEDLQVSVASRGSSLFSSAISVTIRKSEVESLIVNGFFPEVSLTDPVLSGRTGGLHELGLHYEADPAITRHLVNFLQQGGVTARPTCVLFNGGVFNSKILRDRAVSVLKACTNNAELKVLKNPDLDLAVSRGAAYYGILKHGGRGVRVRAGVSRSFYIGIDSNLPAVPGYAPPVMGLCVLPQGTEEGTHVELSARKFSLIVGQPVRFRFFSSKTRPEDGAGVVVPDAARELLESETLSSLMTASGKSTGDFVTVTIKAAVTETGILIISLRDIDSPSSWDLEFSVRTND